MPVTEAKIQQILDKADIKIKGSRPWDLQVNNPKLYQRALKHPSLGMGESYMDAWWDCERLDEFFYRICRYLDFTDIYSWSTLTRFILKNFFSNQQSKLNSKKVAEQHYNLGNDLYSAMLGPSMAYTCAYWRNASRLQDAQYAKYDLVCRKIDLKPGEKVLELGCGWGGFSRHAAKHYGVEMTSVNISTEQMKYAAEICQGLPVDLHICDYRNHQQYNPKGLRFDKVVSIGMCEHVGYKNYAGFIELARQQIKDDGLFLLHTIGKDDSRQFADPWIRKYIFPKGILPSIQRLSQAIEGRFVVEDLHNFGTDYDKTLMAWHENFIASWPEISENYDERFYRMWNYYLLSCAGGFRARAMQLWQIVLSPRGQINGYRSIR